jgi:exodeoxyribonuclease VII large subunit
VPTHLCIITSVGSAAFEDVMHGVRERWPGLRVTAIDSLVQGPRAAALLAAALQRAASLNPAPDVIVVARGGGAAGDLDAFSDEQLVRALVVPGIPVISAIGHETDRCISDEVADARAKTPTAAVELALPASLAERQRELANLRQAGADAAARLLARCLGGPDALAALATSASAAPREALAAARLAMRARAGEARVLVERRTRNHRDALAQQRREARAAAQRAIGRAAPAELRAAAQRAVATCLRRRRLELEPDRALARGAAGAALRAARATLGELGGRAAALSHVCTLKRGYCVLRIGHDGPIVRNAHDLPDGARLTATLADGTLELVLKRARCGD